MCTVVLFSPINTSILLNLKKGCVLTVLFVSFCFCFVVLVRQNAGSHDCSDILGLRANYWIHPNTPRLSVSISLSHPPPPHPAPLSLPLPLSVNNCISV